MHLILDATACPVQVADRDARVRQLEDSLRAKEVDTPARYVSCTEPQQHSCNVMHVMLLHGPEHVLRVGD